VAPRVSQEMKHAQTLLWTGVTAYRAAKDSGISEGSISKSTLCREIIQSVRKAVEILETDAEISDPALFDLFTNELCMPDHYATLHIDRRADYYQQAQARETRAPA
jgi:hypothetical protein